ncbi:MAG: DUF485 domain-containing protein [Rhodocyclaceae bacterium]|jgi:uncharacterized membrane protein (DUF485 family)|nr:DUF485 domain-containing protein [Rhodocyclaceae bacterium]
MQGDIIDRVQANPKYHQLVSTRNRYGWIMTILMLVVYYGYILMIAFDKEWLAQRMGEGVTTLGIPIGVAVIVFTVVITGIYVRRANTEFDAMKDEVIREASK